MGKSAQYSAARCTNFFPCGVCVYVILIWNEKRPPITILAWPVPWPEFSHVALILLSSLPTRLELMQWVFTRRRIKKKHFQCSRFVRLSQSMLCLFSFFFPFIFVFNSCTCSPPPFFFLQLYVFIPTLATLSNLQFSLFKLTRGKVFSRVSPDVILWLTGLKASTN